MALALALAMALAKMKKSYEQVKNDMERAMTQKKGKKKSLGLFDALFGGKIDTEVKPLKATVEEKAPTTKMLDYIEDNQYSIDFKLKLLATAIDVIAKDIEELAGRLSDNENR